MRGYAFLGMTPITVLTRVASFLPASIGVIQDVCFTRNCSCYAVRKFMASPSRPQGSGFHPAEAATASLEEIGLKPDAEFRLPISSAYVCRMWNYERLLKRAKPVTANLTKNKNKYKLKWCSKKCGRLNGLVRIHRIISNPTRLEDTL